MTRAARTYLDYNATSPLHPVAREALVAAYGAALNPSSVHTEGRAARKRLEDAREQLAQAIGCFPREIVFTASATEANRTLLGGFKGTVLASAIEHPSVLKASAFLQPLPVTEVGVIDLAALERALAAAAKPCMVSVMMANNETGIIQPIADVVTLARKYGALVHTDAVQAFGKLPLSIAELGVDYVTLSAHKSGGPVGAAALVIRQGAPGLEPLLTGGGQEFNQRAGTENVPAIAAFAALAAEQDALLAHQHTLGQWRDGFETAILAACPEATVIGRALPRLANTSCIAMPGVKGETQVIALDLEGVAVSAGSACTSGKVGRSHVLGAMNIADDVAETAIRVSSGWATTKQDYETAAAAWHKVYAKATANRAHDMQGKHAA